MYLALNKRAGVNIGVPFFITEVWSDQWHPSEQNEPDKLETYVQVHKTQPSSQSPSPFEYDIWKGSDCHFDLILYLFPDGLINIKLS